MPHRYLITLLCLAVISGGGWLHHQHSAGPQPSSATTFHTLSGNVFDLESLRGKPVLINFWATSCASCIKEMPALNTLYLEHRSEIHLVAVAMPYDPPNHVLTYVERSALAFPVSLDIKAEITQSFGDVSLTPTTYLLNQGGDIVWQHVGPIPFSALQKRIRAILHQNA